MNYHRQFRQFVFLLTAILFVAIRADRVLAADCSDVTPGGNLTLTTSCAFSGTVNGVDSGTGSTNTAVLTIEPGATLTIGGLQSLAMGSVAVGSGTIVIIDGGAFHPGSPLWMADQDVDGYPDSTTQTIGETAPPNGVRRNTITTVTQTDANPSQYCPLNYNPAGTCNYCNTGAIAAQSDPSDMFSECRQFYACNGAYACSLHAKRLFVSSSTSKGNLGGVSGADTTCGTLASGAGLTGTWKAWLSSTTASASSRLSHSSYPYILVNETTKIANDWAGLSSGTILASINRDQTNATVSAGALSWTNTTANGGIFTATSSAVCSNWASNAGGNTGRYGTNDRLTGGEWTNTASGSCNTARRLYCVEQ